MKGEGTEGLEIGYVLLSFLLKYIHLTGAFHGPWNCTYLV